MLKCHELFGFMTPGLAQEILDFVYKNEKPVYRGILVAVAEARKLRPIFYERKPRSERHKDMLEMLSRPRMETVSADLLRNWLLKSESTMLKEFLDLLQIQHKDGIVEDFPTTIEDALLKSAVDALLAKHPKERVIIYLSGFCAMNTASWPNLEAMLGSDERLQLV